MRQHDFKSMNKQSGVVLAVAMIMLFVITLLGVSSISTVTLEEKMAKGTEEAAKAFHLSETGMNLGLSSSEELNTTSVVEIDQTVTGLGTIDVDIEFSQFTNPPKNITQTLSSARSGVIRSAHFDVESISKSEGGAQSKVFAGMYMLVPGEGI